MMILLLSEDADALLCYLDTLPLPQHYKTPHLLATAPDLPTADLPDYLPTFVTSPEPVSLNSVNIQSTFVPSADVLPWHPGDDDPGYRSQECCIK